MGPIDVQAETAAKAAYDVSRSLAPFDPNRMLICVIELSKESWLVAGIIAGVERQPLKKLPADEDKLPEQWRTEAEKAGYEVLPLFWYCLASEADCRN
jgi:hypothetical protein